MNIFPEHFERGLSPAQARALFIVSVSFIEIELFTFCNRKCWFCPNATMPERQDRQGQRMNADLYKRILADLASVGYAGQIAFSRYNEPLAFKDVILDGARQARAACPESFIYTHTNGDYLTPEYIVELAEAGFNALRVQSYLGNEEHWNHERAVARQEEQLKRLNFERSFKVIDLPTRRMIGVDPVHGMDITFDARDFDAIGTDRGGLVDVALKGERMAACAMPFTNMYVDCNGSVMPCCNLRSDRPEHKAYVVSDLAAGASLFDAYAALASWRESLQAYGPKKAPCNSCSYEALQP